MYRTELTRAISDRTGYSIAVIDEVLQAFIDVTIGTIKAGEQVSIRGFGRLVPRRKVAQVKNNPRVPGEKIKVPARTTAVFYPSDSMKEELNAPRSHRGRRK
jgi:DNA-binding protein HU-beta